MEFNEFQDELISIITPVYNSEKYIEEAIQSVLKQTYKKWEMIIVNDCSQDESDSKISFFLNENRIHYIKLKENVGAAKARNIALQEAKGRYIAFLDSDDYWKIEKLEKQFRFMKEKQYGFTFTAYEILNQKRSKIILVPKSLNYSQFMKNTIIGTSTVMIDRRVIGDVRLIDVKKDHDSMTWAMLLRKGNNAYGLNENLSFYRKVKTSISSNKLNAIKNHWINCRKIEKISLLKCMYYFVFYGFNAFKKHRI